MKNKMLWTGRIASLFILFVFCKYFSHPLAQSDTFWHTHFAWMLFIFLLLIALQGTMSYLYAKNEHAWTAKYVLSQLFVLAFVVCVRTVSILYNIDASATYSEAAAILIRHQPQIWLFHGAVQGAYILADWALRLRRGRRGLSGMAMCV